MHKFNGYDIELTRGDSLVFRVSLSGRDLPEGSVGLFTVKANPRDERPVIQKRVDASGEQLMISLAPKDTNLTPRTYFWDVRVLIPLEEGGYELETPMEYASFVILEAIGRDFGVPDDPGMDGDLPVVRLLIEETRQAIRALENAGSGFAPAILVTSDGAAIADAAGGWATSVVSTINPRLEGETFVQGGEIHLDVNGEPFTLSLPDGLYTGTCDWVTGEVRSKAYAVNAAGYSVIDSGTNSTGLNYIQLDMPDLTDVFACNRYVRNDTAPYADKSIRVRNSTIYIYDSAIDLDNPAAILEGLMFLLPLDTPAEHQLAPRQIALAAGSNVVSSAEGPVEVTYGIDTKTYIDNKIAALSAEVLGG